MEMDKISKVHFIGVGGIGISAVAKMMKLMGKQVSGSDIKPSEITQELDKMGVKIFHGHSFDQVPDDVDLVVYTSAVAEDNPERKKTAELGVMELSYFEFLGALSRDKYCIAIAGTHGKSTTTAMAGKLMQDAGLDPTIIVGSKLKQFEYGNFRMGQSKYLVVEACEYQANFLHLELNVLIITNIEAEHLDYYKDVEDVAAAFQRLVHKLPEDGLLIYNADDEVSVTIQSKARTLSFALNRAASLQAQNISARPGKQSFNIIKDGEPYLSGIDLKIPGKFNIYNSLGAITLADSLDISPEIIKKSLQNFSGLWRRMEIVGEYRGATIISDYGHHPTEIVNAIQAAREFYPDKRLVWVFQPHQHNRTKMLFKDFVRSMGGVDVLLIADIFDVAGREELEDRDINSQRLAHEIQQVSPNVQVRYSGDLKNSENIIKQIAGENDVIVIQGAGDIDDVARNLVK